MATPFPSHLVPMLATPGSLPPDDAAWAYEFKWDGYRALAFCERGALRLRTRAENDITGEYPELAPLAQTLPARAILDGEIVALDRAGKPSFHALQNRQRRPRAPIVYMIFDVLHLGGRPLMALPYVDRRARLLALGLAGDAWMVPPHRLGGGARLLAAARRQGLEGIIAKRADSRYVAGKRTGAWIKIKLTRREEFVIGGYLHGSGAFAGALGSLLLGYFEGTRGDQRLLYAGKVGTGFSFAARAALTRRLEGMRRATSPFAVAVPRFPVPTMFCEPLLVAEVAFTEWTPDGMVRHPSFQGLRDDKKPEEVEDPRPR